MLRLSKKADYALMAMRHLALAPERGAASAREIAERYDIPVELLAKVLQRLVRHGFLRSQQGTRGGYLLARPAGLISVADIIQAIDGPVAVTACSSESDACDQYENAASATRCGASRIAFSPRSPRARSRSWRSTQGRALPVVRRCLSCCIRTPEPRTASSG